MEQFKLTADMETMQTKIKSVMMLGAKINQVNRKLCNCVNLDNLVGLSFLSFKKQRTLVVLSICMENLTLG